VTTPVVPSVWSTTRVDLQAALVDILDAFIAAVPGIIRKVWTEVPSSLTGEGPFVYVGDITEEIKHDFGTRSTIFRGVMGYVDILAAPQETNDRIAVFCDYMRDLFTANARILGYGILEQVGLTETELIQGTIRMTNTTVSWTFDILQGRN
jgi:hypothetical protein